MINLDGFFLTLSSPSPEMCIARVLVYNFADLFNKVGFGMVALYAIRQMMKEQVIRRALSAL